MNLWEFLDRHIWEILLVILMILGGIFGFL